MIDPRRKLTPEQVQALRKARTLGVTYRELSQKYGLHEGTIRQIVIGRTYREVPRA